MDNVAELFTERLFGDARIVAGMSVVDMEAEIDMATLEDRLRENVRR